MNTYYDIDQDLIYYACLEHRELWLGVILLIIGWELIKYIVWRLK